MEALRSVIHEAHAIWWIEATALQEAQTFVVALRLSRSAGTAAELRIAIFDPFKYKPCSNDLGCCELERQIHDIFDDTAPSMTTVTTLPGAADTEAKVHRVSDQQKSDIKVVISIQPPGSVPLPSPPPASVDDLMEHLEILTAAHHQRLEKPQRQQRLETEACGSILVHNSSSPKPRPVPTLVPSLRGERYNSRPTMKDSQGKRKRSIGTFDPSGEPCIQIIGSTQDDQYGSTQRVVE
jgi:hypothetical protein